MAASLQSKKQCLEALAGAFLKKENSKQMGGKETGKEKWRKEGEIRSIGLRVANYYT